MQLLPFSCAKLWRNAEHFAACPQTLRRMVRLCCWCWSGAGSWRLRAGCRPRSWAEPFAACTPEVKVFTVLTSAKHMKLLGFFCSGSGLNRASPFFIWREVAVGVKEKVIYELNFLFLWDIHLSELPDKGTARRCLCRYRERTNTSGCLPKTGSVSRPALSELVAPIEQAQRHAAVCPVTCTAAHKHLLTVLLFSHSNVNTA